MDEGFKSFLIVIGLMMFLLVLAYSTLWHIEQLIKAAFIS